MKKFFIILSMVVFFASCAEKKEVFDPTAVFNDAEKHMREGSYEKARKEYQEIQEKAPEKSYDPALMLRVADTYYGEEKFEEASVEYQSFLNYHPANRDAPYAQYQLALCSYNQFLTIDRDPELTRAALREFRLLLSKYPGSAFEDQAKKYIAICLDRLAQYEFYVARFYQKKGSYRAALGRFERLLNEYPGSSPEKDALYDAAVVCRKLGEREKALAELDALVRKYPSMIDEAAKLKTKIEAGAK